MAHSVEQDRPQTFEFAVDCRRAPQFACVLIRDLSARRLESLYVTIGDRLDSLTAEVFEDRLGVPVRERTGFLVFPQQLGERHPLTVEGGRPALAEIPPDLLDGGNRLGDGINASGL